MDTGLYGFPPGKLSSPIVIPVVPGQDRVTFDLPPDIWEAYLGLLNVTVTTGAQGLICQAISGGAIETSGYLGASERVVNGAAPTTVQSSANNGHIVGFGLGGASDIMVGGVRIRKIGTIAAAPGNYVEFTSRIARTDAPVLTSGISLLQLRSTLTGLAFGPGSGDTFASGSVYLWY